MNYIYLTLNKDAQDLEALLQISEYSMSSKYLNVLMLFWKAVRLSYLFLTGQVFNEMYLTERQLL